MLPTTTTTPPAFTAEAVPGVADLRRVVGPLGPCGWCKAEDVDKRLRQLNATYAERRAARAATLARVREGWR